jgi:hypothetical protein
VLTLSSFLKMAPNLVEKVYIKGLLNIPCDFSIDFTRYPINNFELVEEPGLRRATGWTAGVQFPAGARDLFSQ